MCELFDQDMGEKISVFRFKSSHESMSLDSNCLSLSILSPAGRNDNKNIQRNSECIKMFTPRHVCINFVSYSYTCNIGACYYTVNLFTTEWSKDKHIQQHIFRKVIHNYS